MTGRLAGLSSEFGPAQQHEVEQRPTPPARIAAFLTSESMRRYWRRRAGSFTNANLVMSLRVGRKRKSSPGASLRGHWAEGQCSGPFAHEEEATWVPMVTIGSAAILARFSPS